MRRALAAIIVIAWVATRWVLTEIYGIDRFALIGATATILVLPGSNLPEPEASARPDLSDVNDAVDTINKFLSANAPPSEAASRRDNDASPSRQ